MPRGALSKAFLSVMDEHISPGLSEMLAAGQFPCREHHGAITPVRTIDDIRHANLLRLLSELGQGQERGQIAKLAELTGKSHSQISQLKNRTVHSTSGKPRTIGTDLARQIEAACGKPKGWMDTLAHSVNEPPPRWTNIQHQNAGTGLARGREAHPVSFDHEEDAPFISWGALSMEPTKPSRFKVEMPDDSMAPRLRAGHIVRIDTTIEPRPGDAVLVRDGEGRHYVRLYRERRPGLWEAAPINEAYQPLESDRDALAVLGVLTGVDGRWA